MGTPIPRDPQLDLANVPRHWMADNAVATAISNGINLLFPHGERFFVRSVNRFLDQVDSAELRAQVKAFFQQEGHHAHAHDELNAVMTEQGFEVDKFLARYRAIATAVERRMPAKLNLAGTAACEHFTAILADGAFRHGLLDNLDPRMAELLAWHAAEEIEHKAVAFDVLRTVDDSYLLRVGGLLYATTMLSWMWLWASVMLVRQEQLGWRGVLRELRTLRARRVGPSVISRVFLRGIREYLRRDFHPSHIANEHLAREWFAAHGLPFAEASAA